MVIIKDKLKIKILENNKEVLPILLNDIGEDFALVRFDTYADFLLPKDVQADEVQTIDAVIDSFNNQSWILPAVYRGYLTKIFWFKPPWGHQFQDGVYQLQVGKCQQTGLLKVASTLPYFTSNCIYSSSDKLSDIHSVDVYVSTSGLAKTYSTTIEKSLVPVYDNDSGSESLDSDNLKKTKSNEPNSKRIYALDAELINRLLESKQFVIDIDLSFFSTDDPIRKQFDENEYEVLRYVYTRIVQENTDAEILQYMAARENALEQIRTFMNDYLTDPKPDQTIQIDNIYLSALISIIRYKKLDWKSIHNYGMHLSDTRPPLHVSSEGMIHYLIESLRKILESIKKDPILITISRCVEDGFCSLEQADLIQLNLEKKLRKRYKIDEIIGKRLSNDNDNEEDLPEEDNPIDENNTDKTPQDKSIPNESTKALPSKSDTDIPSSINQISPSKSNLSPGEVKPTSPSSLSETSLISN